MGQEPSGVLVAGLGPGVQPVLVAAVGQQSGQPFGGSPITSLGRGAQPIQVTSFG